MILGGTSEMAFWWEIGVGFHSPDTQGVHTCIELFYGTTGLQCYFYWLLTVTIDLS